MFVGWNCLSMGHFHGLVGHYGVIAAKNPPQLKTKGLVKLYISTLTVALLLQEKGVGGKKQPCFLSAHQLANHQFPFFQREMAHCGKLANSSLSCKATSALSFIGMSAEGYSIIAYRRRKFWYLPHSNFTFLCGDGALHTLWLTFFAIKGAKYEPSTQLEGKFSNRITRRPEWHVRGS